MSLEVGIIGASGYTGSELLRILAQHPHVEVKAVTSEQQEGTPLVEAYPFLKNQFDPNLKFEAIGKAQGNPWPGLDILLKRISFFFTALPHGASSPCVAYLIQHGATVIDLSADFRLDDLATYQQWYGDHAAPDLITQAVYGLPELYRESIKQTKLVATPGCYPTGSILALSPLLRKNLIDPENIIIDAKSGTTGAGRTAKRNLLHSEIEGGIRAYSIPQHRHIPEMEQECSKQAQKNVMISFTPHLVPMPRGILSVIYTKPLGSITDKVLQSVYDEAYSKEEFVRVFSPNESLVDTKQVCGSYYCDIAYRIDPRTQRLILITAIDNLNRGASGMSVASMNLIQGWDESTGLKALALQP